MIEETRNMVVKRWNMIVKAWNVGVDILNLVIKPWNMVVKKWKPIAAEFTKIKCYSKSNLWCMYISSSDGKSKHYCMHTEICAQITQ